MKPDRTEVEPGLPAEVVRKRELKPSISTQDVALSGCLRLPTSFGGSNVGTTLDIRLGTGCPGVMLRALAKVTTRQRPGGGRQGGHSLVARWKGPA